MKRWSKNKNLPTFVLKIVFIKNIKNEKKTKEKKIN